MFHQERDKTGDTMTRMFGAGGSYGQPDRRRDETLFMTEFELFSSHLLQPEPIFQINTQPPEPQQQPAPSPLWSSSSPAPSQILHPVRTFRSRLLQPHATV